MTQWFLLFSNPVVFFVAAGSILLITYLVQQSMPEAAFWTLIVINTLLFATVYAAISVIRQLKAKPVMDQTVDGQLYQVFSRNETIIVQLGSNLKRLGKGVNDILRLLMSVRQQLAEQYGYVVPDMEMEYSALLGAQTVQLIVRQDVIGQFDVYPDCLAVPVDGEPTSALIDSIDNQLYAWIPKDEVSLQDKPVAMDARQFMALRIQSMLLDYAPVVISRTDTLKLMAIVQRQDPVIFHDLFELNKLDASTFRTILADMVQQRQSVRNIVLICDTLLKGDTGISQLTNKQNASELKC
jgi:flagellar biosynthesis component FlhA